MGMEELDAEKTYKVMQEARRLRMIEAMKAAQSFTIKMYKSEQPHPWVYTACNDCANVDICRLLKHAEKTRPTDWADDIIECSWHRTGEKIINPGD